MSASCLLHGSNLTLTAFPSYGLQKLIKELPSLVPSDEAVDQSTKNNGNRADSPLSMTSNNGRRTKRASVVKTTKKENIGTSPGERAFFKLLRLELNKAMKFFERAKQELSIRNERVRDGIEIMKNPGSTMVSEKWSSMAKAVYRLYKDLLLLELYAIMTYTSFSKILKKHDKNTGYDTRVKFMANVVNRANFTHYPDLLEMIRCCEEKYEEVDRVLVTEGKSTSALDEDERLFISMIHRFYGQIMDKAEEEGADVTQRKEGLDRRRSIITGSQKPNPESSVTSSLKSLIEENEANKSGSAASACLSDDPDDNRNRKKRLFETNADENQKRPKKTVV